MSKDVIEETEVVMDTVYLLSFMTAVYKMGRENLIEDDRDLKIAEFMVLLIAEEIKNRNIDLINKSWQ